MNAEQRLNLINKIAQNAALGAYFLFDGDEYWLIGMLSDTTMSDDKLKEEIESVKKDFPEYAELFWKNLLTSLKTLIDSVS